MLRLLTQCLQGFLKGGNLALGICHLLALQFNHLSRCVLYEALVLQLLLDASHETLEALDFCFRLLCFGVCVNEVAQGHGILLCAYKVALTTLALLFYTLDFRQVCHLYK